jgi:hypothetical protein
MAVLVGSVASGLMRMVAAIRICCNSVDRSWDVDECVAGGWRVRLLQFEGKLCACVCVCVGGK